LSEGPRPPAIELIGIEKRFGRVHANRDVSLAVEAGSITGIIGENGAGKSTLMGVLYGLHAPDAGEVRVDGAPVAMSGPREAIARGIGMVHQHFKLVDPFTAVENVVLGAEGGALLSGSLARARTELERLERDYGLAVPLDRPVGALPVGERQRVEILKVLYRGARVLILDEPTAVLTPPEVEQLFRILRALAARGVTVLLITHKLKEIMAVTDAVHVMRQGAVVAHRRTAETSPGELAALMVGRPVRLDLERAPLAPGPVLMRAEGLGLADERGVSVLADIDLELRAGEIVGIAGVSGNGQDALLDVLSGIRAPTSGRLTVGERTVEPGSPADPAAMRALGVAHVPEDRHRYGMVSAAPASETAVLGYHRRKAFSRGGLLDPGAVRRHCASVMQRFDVRPPDPDLVSGGFSGGNQQKLVIGREVAEEPRVLLVGQPTRGVDIGAIALIHRELMRLRSAGRALLVVSAELDEVMALADRILVMVGGRLVGEVSGREADEGTLGRLMAGLAPGETLPPVRVAS
jgi:general nucleoside transport system ATP-binding protein